MEDYDFFTNEINLKGPAYTNILNKFVSDIPGTPNGPNYQSGRKLLAEESFIADDHLACAFHLSEAVSASLRTFAVYRDEQSRCGPDSQLHMVTSFIEPVKKMSGNKNCGKTDKGVLNDFYNEFHSGIDNLLSVKCEELSIDENEPLHRRYLKFTAENNADNLQKILKDLPKEWTIVQLTAPYNPNENLLPLNEYKCDIQSLMLTIFTNDYLDDSDVGPLTLLVPGYVPKPGETALFTELHSLLDENYKTIENAVSLNTKRLVQNYWKKREDVDLRMKSVINVMDKQWLGGWSCLLTGKLVDSTIKDKVRNLVDKTIDDWGFIKLTQKQRLLLYNLIESCQGLSSAQIKTCIRRILTEAGDLNSLKQVLAQIDCSSCKEISLASEACLKCLSRSFEMQHQFTLVDGIKAFSQAALQVRENEQWECVRNAIRHPVILIVDEILDTFPWESLPLLNQHPVSRIENIHFLYNLYKVHEDNIVDGYFNITPNKGRYVINPDNNLDRMEKRMTSFVQYWCPHWSGEVARPPPPDAFLAHLREADIFLYCGHGDGCQYAVGAAQGAGVEGALGTRAISMLSGCGSSRLTFHGPRAPPAASHHHYHIANSPTVIGMLWEVTDLEVDKVVSSLLALCVPSAAPVPWPAVGKANWSQGNLDTAVEAKVNHTEHEQNFLTAVARARRSTNFVMIASSVVARGLPVMIRDPQRTVA